MTDVQRRRQSALIGAAALSAVFALMAVLVHAKAGWLVSLDRSLGQRPERFTADHRWLLDTANAVAALTHPDSVVLVVALTAVALVVKGNGRAAVWSVLVIVTARWTYVVLKQLIERPRPEWKHPAAHAGGWSFPSGHATVIGAGAGILIVLAIMFAGTRALRRRLIVGAVAIALLVGLDRILLGVHYCSDVLAGLVLGGVITLAALAAFDPLPRARGATIAR